MAAIEWWIYVLSAYELIHLCKSSDKVSTDGNTVNFFNKIDRPSIRYLQFSSFYN